MTKKETAMIMAVLQAAFPSYYRNISPDDAKAAVNLWHEMFLDDDYLRVSAAVKAIIATQVEGFPPTIGAVKEKLLQFNYPNQLSPQDAWVLVSKAAAGNLAYDKLPPLVQKAIGSPNVLKEWGMLEVSVFNSVIYSQFIKAYKIYEKREIETVSLPGDVRKMIQGVADKLALTERNST